MMTTNNIFPTKKYDVIYADPPWTYRDKMKMDGNKVGVIKQYKTQTKEWIWSLPVPDIANDDCCLFLWATSPMLPLALETMGKWGFAYKTVAFCWSKYTKSGYEATTLGRWTHGNVEMCLLGTRGKPSKWREDKTVRQLVKAKRTAHSTKPDAVRERIIQMLGYRSRVELFARKRVWGWDAWGDDENLCDEVGDGCCERRQDGRDSPCQ